MRKWEIGNGKFEVSEKDEVRSNTQSQQKRLAEVVENGMQTLRGDKWEKKKLKHQVRSNHPCGLSFRVFLTVLHVSPAMPLNGIKQAFGNKISERL